MRRVAVVAPPSNKGVSSPAHVSGVSQVHVAVLGTGHIGRKHLETLRALDLVHPVAIPMHPERVAQMQAAGHSTARDLDHARRLGAPLCIIATDTSRHVQDGVAALERGFDVLVEKPLAADLQGARALSLRASALGRRLFVGCVLRFSESLNTFRQLLETVGCLHMVRIECQSYLPDWRPGRPYRDSYSARADEGGVLRDLIHEIDYAGWLFGWPRSVQARIQNLGRLGIEAEELAELTWELPEGGLVSMTLDYLTRPSRRRLRASGEQGTLEWDGIAGTVAVALAGEEPQLLRSNQTRDELFLAQDRAVIEACGGRSDPRLATADDGVRALAVCEAAQRANASRREEAVEYQ